MTPGITGTPALQDVTLALDAQGDVIHLKLLGNEYDDFRVPFSREDVEHGLEHATPDRGVDPLTSFGARLFNTLFTDERQKAWWKRLGRVTAENGAIRLRILTNLERLQHLPWELLFDSSRQDFIALSGRVALVRTRPDGYDRQADLAPLPRLRILAVTADRDGRLRADEELASFRERIAGATDTVELETLEQASPQRVLQKLDTAQFDVFLFFGTGWREDNISKAGGLRQAVALIPDDEADTGLLKRNTLGAALRRAKVRLAVMNGSDTDWIARSLAKHVPAALGFREHVRPQTRRVAIEALGNVLLRGVPLDLGITGVRQAIDQSQPGSGEWCRLIFYLQPAEGNFLLAPGAQPAAVEFPAPETTLNRELAKLMRLRQIYTTNLSTLELEAQLPATLVETFRSKLANLDEQIAEARNISPGNVRDESP